MEFKIGDTVIYSSDIIKYRGFVVTEGDLPLFEDLKTSNIFSVTDSCKHHRLVLIKKRKIYFL